MNKDGAIALREKHLLSRVNAMPRILLVEDDVGVQFVMEMALLGAGHAVDIAGTMREGCDLVDSRTYDLVIADGKLPDGTGMDIVDRAKRRNDTKAIMVTGYLLPDELMKQYGVLLKPITSSELTAAVDRELRD